MVDRLAEGNEGSVVLRKRSASHGMHVAAHWLTKGLTASAAIARMSKGVSRLTGRLRSASAFSMNTKDWNDVSNLTEDIYVKL